MTNTKEAISLMSDRRRREHRSSSPHRPRAFR
uniref:Uncharacterized protein n=1 Tax=Human herpesvirus 2 TaxID=10310 RepID=A0A481TNY4_HHV2|nr:hypothetical protein [Human alphaherpesvirus 2]QBH83730.1 hypothetical protein [Human alphaherpesvirus 2]